MGTGQYSGKPRIPGSRGNIYLGAGLGRFWPAKRRQRPVLAELQGPRKPFRIRPEIFVFEPDSGLKLDQTKPVLSGTVPTNRHTTIPNHSGPISACFDDDPKLNCEIAQPSSPELPAPSAQQSNRIRCQGPRGVPRVTECRKSCANAGSISSGLP